MEIILIRHAQSKGNKADIVQGHTDEGLSELGIKQALELANYFNAGDLTAIYSSDLGRAIQTAQPTAEKLGLEIIIDPDLRETHFGHSEGKTFNEVKEKYSEEYNAWHDNYFLRPSWFESFESHFNRIKEAIEKIINNHSTNERIAVFTHGGSIKTQLAFFNKSTGKEMAKYRTLNCSLTRLKFNPIKNYENGRLICYNEEVISYRTKREN